MLKMLVHNAGIRLSEVKTLHVNLHFDVLQAW